MKDPEAAVRAALETLLRPVEPRALPLRTLTRARRRRAVATALAGSVAAVFLAAGAWGTAVLRGPATSGEPGEERGPAAESSDARGPHLFLSGVGEMWRVDLEGNVVHARVPELDPGDPPHYLVARAGRLVGWGYETYLMDPELQAEPEVLVPDSLLFIPSSVPDRVWVAIPEPEPSSERAVRAVREVTVDGEVTVSDVRPPSGDWPGLSTDRGLVFHSPDGWEVWDPRRDEVVFRFGPGDLGPASGDLVAWCETGCRSLHLTDVATGSRTTVDPPPGFAAFEVRNGSFSPDGETLAIPVRTDAHPLAEVGAEAELALVDVAAGTAAPVAGVEPLEAYHLVAWSSDSAYVFYAGGPNGRRVAFVHRIGDDGARRIDAQLGDFYDAAAL